MKVVIIGPAYPLRGGLATFDHRLCKAFAEEGHTASIYSFSLQYPGFLFPGTTQYSSDPPPVGIEIHTLINSINPLSWLSTGRRLRKEAPDLLVVRYWLPFMGPALGTILRQMRKNRKTKIIAITDNVLPHEKRPGDVAFTRYFLKSCDAFVTMSDEVMQDLRRFEKQKPAQKVIHPLYDNFGEIIPKEKARQILKDRLKLNIEPGEKIILFFGFIRKYKGLDILLRAMAEPAIREAGIRLLIAGEYYEDPKMYEDLISSLQIEDLLIRKTDFIPDSEVQFYLCAADAVVQPYRHATQSGVTPLAYHFERPMIVSNVGGLAAHVIHEQTGLVAEPEPASIAKAIQRFYELGEDYFIPHLRTEKKRYSWKNLVNTILGLSHDIQK
ncbi:MAG: glycosyltransferase [Bacteroidota bacterium]|nr:glycosyltransferase [Bacteroidota bacterium]MDP4252187.1 glycosyltransferase [Bacteroidota bacterium]